MSMKEKRRVLTLNDYEHRIVIRALNDLRTSQLEKDKPTEDVDRLIIRAVDAPRKRIKPDNAR